MAHTLKELWMSKFSLRNLRHIPNKSNNCPLRPHSAENRAENFTRKSRFQGKVQFPKLHPKAPFSPVTTLVYRKITHFRLPLAHRSSRRNRITSRARALQYLSRRRRKKNSIYPLSSSSGGGGVKTLGPGNTFGANPDIVPIKARGCKSNCARRSEWGSPGLPLTFTTSHSRRQQQQHTDTRARVIVKRGGERRAGARAPDAHPPSLFFSCRMYSMYRSSKYSSERSRNHGANFAD